MKPRVRRRGEGVTPHPLVTAIMTDRRAVLLDKGEGIASSDGQSDHGTPDFV
jgi:hypothetical protein